MPRPARRGRRRSRRHHHRAARGHAADRPDARHRRAFPAGPIAAQSLPAIRWASAPPMRSATRTFSRGRDRGDQLPRAGRPARAADRDGGASAAAKGSALKGVRKAWFEGGVQDVRIYDRYALKDGDVIDGPAIVEERESTTVIAPRRPDQRGWRAQSPHRDRRDARRRGGRPAGIDRARPSAASRPIRSGSRSCGAGWSMSSRRCG